MGKSPKHRNTIVVFGLLLGIAGILYAVARMFLVDQGPQLKPTSHEDRTGSLFLPAPKDPFLPPQVHELSLPELEHSNSIWGSTGRDPRGRIWIGVSSRSTSANLLRYSTQLNAWQNCGAVVEQLKRQGQHREGETQIKIHSKIVPADDGWLYFASTDEDGEVEDGTKLPRWGGHLWRINPDNCRWGHLKTVAEGLVAVSGAGRHVYALGYWGHVLYQYDTLTGVTKRIVVGSVGGHVSRNMLADANGHAYVPRLAARPDGKVSAVLVEYDSELREQAVTPLEFYLDAGSPDSNHGIVGVAALPDGRLLFTTHRGQIYQIEPAPHKSAAVTALGWLHPDGEAYAPSLFALGGNLVASVTGREARYEWVVFDLQTRTSIASPLDTKNLPGVLLYGSMTRDNGGRFYVGGWARAGDSVNRPLLLQISPAP